MAYGLINADVIGTSVAGSNIGAGNASIMKNRIINGAMVIDQRNAGASVAVVGGNYSVDRWQVFANVTSKLTAQQNAGSVTPPVGFNNYLGFTSLSAYTLTAGDSFFVSQNIEGFNFADLGFGTVNAKTVTISAWVYSSLTGTFGGSLINYAGTRSYPFTYTIPVANTWTQISITLAGDTAGTWNGANNNGSASLIFSMGAGSTYSATAGSWVGGNYRSATGATSVVGTNGATFYITGVQLEVGSSATGFEYVNYQTSLTNCQRYFQSYSKDGLMIGVGYAASSSAVYRWGFSLNQTMRSAPTLTFNNISMWSGSNTPAATIGTNYSSINYAQADVSVSGLGFGSTGAVAEAYINTSGSIQLSAEL